MKHHRRLYSPISHQIAGGQTCLSLYWHISKKKTNATALGKHKRSQQTAISSTVGKKFTVHFRSHFPQRKSTKEKQIPGISCFAVIKLFSVCINWCCQFEQPDGVFIYPLPSGNNIACCAEYDISCLLNLLFHCHSIIIDSIPSVHLPSCSISISPQSNIFSPYILYMQGQESLSMILMDPVQLSLFCDSVILGSYDMWLCLIACS